MRQVVLIPAAMHRRMGEKNVKSPAPHELEPQLPDPLRHFLLRALIAPVVVAHGTPEPEDPDPFVHIDLIVYADTAFRRFHVIDVIMISVHIQERTVGKGNQEGQVGRRKIPCGKNQVHSLQLRLIIEIPEGFAGLIRQ